MAGGILLHIHKCSLDYIILKAFVEVYEIIAVASDTDYKVTVIFGVRFSGKQVFGGYNRNGKLLTAAREKGFGKRNKGLLTFWGIEQFLFKFVLEYKAAASIGVVVSENGFDLCGRPIGVASRCCGNTVSE